jgi:hypothetical protein
MRAARRSGSWHFRVLRVACAALPKRVRQEQFNEWCDEIQSARESGLPAGRRTFSIVFRSVPRLAWRARRSSERHALAAVGGLGEKLPTWGAAGSSFMRPIWFLILLVGPLVTFALGIVQCSWSGSFNGSSFYITNENLTHSSSPGWLSGVLYLVGLFALIALLWVSIDKRRLAVRAALNGEREVDTEAPKVWITCPLILIVVLVVKMVVFSQYSPWLYFAIAACAIFLIVSVGDRSQRRRSVAPSS